MCLYRTIRPLSRRKTTKSVALFLVFIGAPLFARAQVVSFDADTYPELAGWTRDYTNFPSERWLAGSWLFEWAGYNTAPYEPQRDTYRRSIAEFAGVQAFFVEWHLQTNGDRAGIPSGAPAVLTASGTMGILYHFTIASDQARLIDPYLNVTLFEIAPDLPHVFRLEVRGRAWIVFIDGRQMNAGVASGSYPTSDSRVVFGTLGSVPPATTRWDYIRFGVIPDPAGPGDTNCDGTINLFDIDPFVAALIDADGYGRAHPACNRMLADTNADGTVNIMDIDSFVALLTW